MEAGGRGEEPAGAGDPVNLSRRRRGMSFKLRRLEGQSTSRAAQPTPIARLMSRLNQVPEHYQSGKEASFWVTDQTVNHDIWLGRDDHQPPTLPTLLRLML